MKTKMKHIPVILTVLFGLPSIALVDAPFLLNQSNGLVSNDTTRLLVASDGSVYIGTYSGLSRFKDGAIQNNFTSAAGGRYLEIVTAIGEGRSTDPNIASVILVGKGRNVDGGIGYGFEKLSWNQAGHAGWGDPSEPIYTRYANRWISSVTFNASQEFEVLALNHTSGSGRRNVGELSVSLDPNFLAASDNLLSGEGLYAILDWNEQKLIGGDNGLFVFDSRTQLSTHLDGSTWRGKAGFLFATSNRSVRALAKDSLGNVWIGLQGGAYEAGGLVNYKPSAQDLLNGTWSTAVSLPGGNDVRSLAIDGDDNLWIATNNGLTRRTPDGAFHNFGVADGLPSADIRDIAYDAKTKYLWIATGAGVTRLLIQ